MASVNFIPSKGDCSEKLESFINGLSDNTTVVLRGECYLSRKVLVRNKRDLAIVGEDAKIITAFNPMEGFEKYSGAFAFEACENLTLKNLRESIARLPVGEQICFLYGGRGNFNHLKNSAVTFEDCKDVSILDITVHSTAGFITEADGNSIKVINKRFDIPLDENWCQKGDVIAVYDSDFVRKGSLTVEKYEDSRVYYSVCEGKAEVGDVVANTFYNAEILVENCEVRNSRARALLFRTENITVRNCKFFGMSLPAILMAPYIVVWHEMSPVKNVLIEHCTFQKCGFVGNNEANAVISVKTSHDGLQKTE